MSAEFRTVTRLTTDSNLDKFQDKLNKLLESIRRSGFEVPPENIKFSTLSGSPAALVIVQERAYNEVIDVDGLHECPVKSCFEDGF